MRRSWCGPSRGRAAVAPDLGGGGDMEPVNTDGGSSGDRRGVWRGAVVLWEGERYVVKRRRRVDGLAMFSTSEYEVFLANPDGTEGAGWVGEGEVEVVMGAEG
ncbi:MAG: hypothetical protein LC104_16745 [Bacteroidales bacterium]|nr:hypothetical protein [Bacteroidales bacterium]